MRLLFIAFAVLGCVCLLDLKPAQAQCYIAMRADAVDYARIRVESEAGSRSRSATVDITPGNNVYCVPTVCPRGYTSPARIDFYQPGKFFTIRCSGQNEERLVYPGAPTCYGSYGACASSNTPELLFTTSCTYV